MDQPFGSGFSCPVIMIFGPEIKDSEDAGTAERRSPRKSGKSADDVMANVLRRLLLLDSPREPEFTRFTRLVCHEAEVPIALVSFVEENACRQYFKSAKGLPDGLSQTDLDRSFCRIVTRTGAMLAVSDARTDERVGNNPIIDEMGVISYLGAPISGPSGETLGSLCALDRVPRDWSDNQKRSIMDLADCVTDYIALRHARLAEDQLENELPPVDRVKRPIGGSTFVDIRHPLPIPIFRRFRRLQRSLPGGATCYGDEQVS